MRILVASLLWWMSAMALAAECPVAFVGAHGTGLRLDAGAGSAPAAAAGRGAGAGYVQGADPFVLRDPAGVKYLFTTNRPATNVPVYRAESDGEWASMGDALPAMPGWAARGQTWAPEAMRLHDGRYALWFTAKDRQSGKQCIGRALAERPEGPYRDPSKQPFVCDPKRDTSIDPSPYRDEDGKLYLLWKTKDTTRGAVHTTIWLSPLDAQGELLPVPAKALLVNDQPWEGEHVEAPTLLKRDGRYYLFYSAGATTRKGYLVSYATSSRIDGPYTKSEKILLGGNSCGRGAGHQSVVAVGNAGGLIYFHGAHPERRNGPEGPARFIDVAHICFARGEPRVQDRPCGQ